MKGWRVYVLDEDDTREWDGAKWKQSQPLDIGLLVAQLSRAYGWTVPEVMALSLREVEIMLGKLPRVMADETFYLAARFLDNDALRGIYDAGLSPAERWDKYLERMRN